MSTRIAQRMLTAALLVAGATAMGTGAAHAGVANLSADGASSSAGYAPAYHHHHSAPNCNNDPDSEYAMDRDACPPSQNAGDHYAEEGYPGDYGYGYPGY